MIIDNYAEYFELEESDLVKARNDAEGVFGEAFENQKADNSAASARSDSVLWIKDLNRPEDSALPNINKIGISMSAFRLKLNEKS